MKNKKPPLEKPLNFKLADKIKGTADASVGGKPFNFKTKKHCEICHDPHCSTENHIKIRK